ncbi:DinB family protein [Priestia aryabhattai]|uniref:DinB family protein n=1 Tax=Priestia aryabhattai TaxID=412384 RepID=UPI001C0C335A|nr:DinB family protein [Priestia aryabhattai]MBU3568870.1 DinB family protein [Priestia aryabhattai]
MKEEIIFKQLESVRSITMELLESIPESEWDVIPKGFRNNIRWNAGHILTIQDFFTNSFRSLSEHLPEKYWAYFGKDTSPADWTEKPPSKEVLLKLLKEQPASIHTRCEGKLDQKLDKPFKGAETLGELLLIGNFHDGMHTGVINAQRKIISENK